MTAPPPLQLRPLGRTGLMVPGLCLGTSPLASMPGLYGYEVGAERAEATVTAALDSGITFVDTANSYGAGSAERRVGAVLDRSGGVPPGAVIATKVDPDPESGAFDADRIQRSVEESLDRLGLDRVQLMYLHDPEYHLTFATAMAPGGPVEAMTRLRDEGVLTHLGVAGGPVALMTQYIATGVFEVVINHNRFTLVDRSAGQLMDEAADRGVAFVNGAPYGGGMLARGPALQPRYAYRETPETTRDAVRAMDAACARHGIELAVAALQFSLRDPRVTSTIVGLSKPERVAETLAMAETDVPVELWAELDGLALPPALWLDR